MAPRPPQPCGGLELGEGSQSTLTGAELADLQVATVAAAGEMMELRILRVHSLGVGSVD